REPSTCTSPSAGVTCNSAPQLPAVSPSDPTRPAPPATCCTGSTTPSGPIATGTASGHGRSTNLALTASRTPPCWPLPPWKRRAACGKHGPQSVAAMAGPSACASAGTHGSGRREADSSFAFPPEAPLALGFLALGGGGVGSGAMVLAAETDQGLPRLDAN